MNFANFMKSNKKRIDARFPNWILEWMLSVRIKYDWTFTECLIRCTEKGLAYYEKQWNKMHPPKKETEDNKPSGNRCSFDSRKNDIPEEEIVEEVSDEEVDKIMKELFGDDYQKEKKK